jgi:hypothetical protein
LVVFDNMAETGLLDFNKKEDDLIRLFIYHV